jgi:hypothetical protein
VTATTARFRRTLLGLYVLTALGDAAGKTLAANETINAALARHLPPALAGAVEDARRPAGNFEIFRAASRHLVAGENLYAPYPHEVQDRFKYSPAFALLFAPFAWLPWPVALFLWSTLNAVLLFVAVDRLLAPPAAGLALACLLPEVLRSMQNGQSNALVAALIIFAFLALERGRAWRAASAAVLGAFVKIFPLAALTFAVPRRETWRVALAAAAVAVALALAPLAVASPEMLLAQYRWWACIESVDAHQRWLSVMELLHRWLGVDWPNWPVQLAGAIVLVSPMLIRRDRWADRGFRTLFLCSVLLYVTLFNHQAERSSYLIAFTGATIWFAIGARTAGRIALYSAAMLTIPLMSTLLPIPDVLRSPTATLYRLAVPALAIWVVTQWDLVAGRLPAPSAAAGRMETIPASATRRGGLFSTSR